MKYIPPPKFRRSSERVDHDAELALREWAFKDAAEEDRALEDYEALSFGVSGASASVHCFKPTVADKLGKAA